MLHKVITNQSKATLIKQAPTLFSILTKTFDIRRQMSQQTVETSDSELSSLEQQQNALTLDAVMKLNDAVFRPFFVRLTQWATEGLPKKDSQGRVLRLTSFYGFLARFFEALKVGQLRISTGHSLTFSSLWLQATPATYLSRLLRCSQTSNLITRKSASFCSDS